MLSCRILPQILTKSKIIIFTQSLKCMSLAAVNVTCPNKQENYQELKNNRHDNEMDRKPVGWDTALSFDAIPGPKPLPIIGNFCRFVPPFGEYSKIPSKDLFRRLHDQYGNVFVLQGIGRPLNLSLIDPQDMETVYRNDGPWPFREAIPSCVYYRTIHRKNEFEEPGLASTQGEEWNKLRSKLNPIMMQPRAVTTKVPEINETCQDFIRNIEILVRKNKDGIMPDNFAVEIQKFSLESMGALVLDTRLGCLEPNLPQDSPAYENIKAVVELFDLVYKLDIKPSLWRYISTPNWRRFVKVMDIIHRENKKYVDEALKKLNSESVRKPENKRSVLDKLIRSEPKIAVVTALDLMMAGVDTSSVTLTSALYALAKNPEKQEKLREESRKNLPNKDTPVTEEVLENSPYTRAAIKETLRIYTTASINLRTTQTDLVLGGYQVPKGTQVILQHYLSSTVEKYYKNASEFIPERWMRTNRGELSHKNAHPFAYMPFGYGPRTCLGKRFVMMELETALLKITRNFKVSWPHREEPHFEQKLLYGITSPLRLKFEAMEN